MSAPQRSHTLALLLRLWDMGIAPAGTFNVMEIHHDSYCATLVTHSTLDCTCDPEVEVNGCHYLYSELFAEGN